MLNLYSEYKIQPIKAWGAAFNDKLTLCPPQCMNKVIYKCIGHTYREIGCYQKGGYDLKLAKKH